MMYRKLSSLFFICIAALALSACQIPEKPDYSVGPFSAKYYYEDDGRNPGTGTDGTDSTIVPVLMYEETVTRPAINYIYDYEFGIDSYNFYGEWEGEVVVNNETEINANFDLSWSDVSFYVDDTLILKWNNSNKIIPLSLATGTHNIRIEYHNHWHTTGFNVSFTNYRKSDTSEDISGIMSDNAQISYIAAHESSWNNSKYNEIEITLPAGDTPHVLFLSSYNAVNWIINNPYNASLEGVVFYSYGPGSTVSNAADAFIIEASNLTYDFRDSAKQAADVKSMTGREPDYMFSQYGMLDVGIPTI